jgi:4-hydroxybutyryl-CoA dehydratase/vinylacetyl-CoA-Delta-isomerase
MLFIPWPEPVGRWTGIWAQNIILVSWNTIKMVQRKDLSVAGALTEPSGKRSQKTLDWPDPYLSLKLVDKIKDSIVVRGAKINISGAFASHELVVLPKSPTSRARKTMP